MKVVLFGIGNIASKTLRKIECIPDIIVDNNIGTWGKKFADIEVQNPEVLRGDLFCKVIICTTSYKDVIKQLGEYGISNYQVSPVLREVVATDRIEDINFDILFVSGLPSTQEDLNGGGVFRLKGDFGKYEITKIHSGNCHGIAVNEENSNEIYITDTSNGIVVLDRTKVVPKRIIEFPYQLRPHGIHVISESEILMACSYDDAVVKINGNGEVIKKFSIKSFSNNENAVHHVNDLSYFNEAIYVSMFSSTGSWQEGFLDGAIKKIDINTGEVVTIYSDLQMPHNINVGRSGMMFCNSLTGEVLGNNRRRIFQGNGFVRGLFECEDYYIVAESKNRNFASIVSPILNNCLDTRINFVDKNTAAYKSIQLPIGISEIHGILELTNV